MNGKGALPCSHSTIKVKVAGTHGISDAAVKKQDMRTLLFVTVVNANPV